MSSKASVVLLIAIWPAVASIAVAGRLSAQDANPLADTYWRLVEFQSMDDAVGTTRPEDPDAYTLALQADGSVRMRLDCNHGSGLWRAESGPGGESGRFRFEPLTVTEAVCPAPSMGQRMAAQARWIRSFLLRDGRLYLSLFADGGIAVWEPVGGDTGSVGIPAGPDRGGPRRWEVAVRTVLNLRERPTTTAPVLLRYRPGTELDNLGCRWAEGRSWCDVREVGGGPRGYVAAEYLRPAMSPDGSATSGPDDSAIRESPEGRPGGPRRLRGYRTPWCGAGSGAAGASRPQQRGRWTLRSVRRGAAACRARLAPGRGGRPRVDLPAARPAANGDGGGLTLDLHGGVSCWCLSVPWATMTPQSPTKERGNEQR